MWDLSSFWLLWKGHAGLAFTWGFGGVNVGHGLPEGGVGGQLGGVKGGHARQDRTAQGSVLPWRLGGYGLWGGGGQVAFRFCAPLLGPALRRLGACVAHVSPPWSLSSALAYMFDLHRGSRYGAMIQVLTCSFTTCGLLPDAAA